MFGKQFNFEYIEEKLSSFVELNFKPTKDTLPVEIEKQLQFLQTQREKARAVRRAESDTKGSKEKSELFKTSLSLPVVYTPAQGEDPMNMKYLKGTWTEETFYTYIYSGVQYDLRQNLPTALFTKLHPILHFQHTRKMRLAIKLFAFDPTFNYDLTPQSSYFTAQQHTNYMDMCYGNDVL